MPGAGSTQVESSRKACLERDLEASADRWSKVRMRTRKERGQDCPSVCTEGEATERCSERSVWEVIDKAQLSLY